MLRKTVSLFCLTFVLFFSISAYAKPTAVNFDSGFLPDTWSVMQPKEETPISGVKVYQNEKLVKVEKNTDSPERAEAVKTFDKIYGPGSISFIFSFAGSDTSYFEFKALPTSEKPALKFAVGGDGLFYIDNDENPILIKGDLNENENYTLKLSGTFTAKRASVTIDGGSSTEIEYLSDSGASNLTALCVYAEKAGNSITLYQFSTDSIGSKYCWDEFQEETETAKWKFTCGSGDAAGIFNSGAGSYLSMYVARAGQQWENGDKINSDIRATLEKTSGDYKVTVRYAAAGDAEMFIRLCRSNGGYWLANYSMTGNSFGYYTTTSNGPVPYQNLKQMQMHTVTLYCDRAARRYDLYFDGEEVVLNQDQVSAGADVYLGWMMMQIKNNAQGGMRIYSFDVEDDYHRALEVSDGVFTDASGNEITAIREGRVNGTYTISNNSREAVKSMVVMMYYQGNTLKDISVYPLSVGVGVTASGGGWIDVPSTDNASIRMCLWKNLNEIVPLTETTSVLK